jgi:hypothetical protein
MLNPFDPGVKEAGTWAALLHESAGRLSRRGKAAGSL